MGLFDRLFGDQESQRERPSTTPPPSQDERAVQRYRYLLETAPPEAIERVHAEAFAKLSPEQRRQVLADLSAGLPEGERPRSDDPQAMARAATRGEVSQPGFLQRTLGGGGGRDGAQGAGPSFGAMVGGSLLGTVAGYVIGSAIVSAFLPPVGFDGGAADGAGADAGTTDAAAADAGGYDAGGADAGRDFGGDVGGADFGGGDFGGGDFGGGDFGGF